MRSSTAIAIEAHAIGRFLVVSALDSARANDLRPQPDAIGIRRPGTPSREPSPRGAQNRTNHHSLGVGTTQEPRRAISRSLADGARQPTPCGVGSGRDARRGCTRVPARRRGLVPLTPRHCTASHCTALLPTRRRNRQRKARARSGPPAASALVSRRSLSTVGLGARGSAPLAGSLTSSARLSSCSWRPSCPSRAPRPSSPLRA